MAEALPAGPGCGVHCGVRRRRAAPARRAPAARRPQHRDPRPQDGATGAGAGLRLAAPRREGPGAPHHLRRRRACRRGREPVGGHGGRIVNRDAAAARHRGAPGRLHRAHRHGDRERGGARRVECIAGARGRQRRRDEAQDRARPSRRRAAALRLARLAASGSPGIDAARPSQAGRRTRPGRHRAQGRARRSARALTRHPPGDPRGGRARACAAGARTPLPCTRRARCADRGPAARTGRGHRLLHRL